MPGVKKEDQDESARELSVMRRVNSALKEFDDFETRKRILRWCMGRVDADQAQTTLFPLAKLQPQPQLQIGVPGANENAGANGKQAALDGVA